MIEHGQVDWAAREMLDRSFLGNAVGTCELETETFGSRHLGRNAEVKLWTCQTAQMLDGVCAFGALAARKSKRLVLVARGRPADRRLGWFSQGAIFSASQTV